MAHGKRLSPELIGILAVGLTLAGLMLNGQSRTDARLVALDARVSTLEQGLAHIRGLIEGSSLFAPREASTPRKR